MKRSRPWAEPLVSTITNPSPRMHVRIVPSLFDPDEIDAYACPSYWLPNARNCDVSGCPGTSDEHSPPHGNLTRSAPCRPEAPMDARVSAKLPGAAS